MERSYGLDFGTSNSSIALAGPHGVQVIPVDPHAPNPSVLATLLYIERGGSDFIGSRASGRFVEQNTGRERKLERVSTGQIIETVFGDEYVQFDADVNLPGRLFQAVKSFLPDRLFEGTNVFGTFVTIEELVARILRPIKARADTLTGAPLDSVVLGRPVRFSADPEPERDRLAQTRLEAAARLAGFRDIHFLYEPLGAALAYEAQLDREELALVFDFGGGTLDYSVVRLGPERIARSDRRDDVLSVGGVVIGGNTFDQDLMEKRLFKYFGNKYVGRNPTGKPTKMPAWILAELRTWYTIPLLNERKTLRTLRDLLGTAQRGKRELQALLALIQRNYGWDLFQAIEACKIALSAETKSEIAFFRDPIRIREPLSRREFELIIAQRLRVMEGEMDATLTRASVRPDQINVVLRTGGSSLIPAVEAMLERKFGADRVIRQQVFTSVVTGLALAGRSRFI